MMDAAGDGVFASKPPMKPLQSATIIMLGRGEGFDHAVITRSSGPKRSTFQFRIRRRTPKDLLSPSDAQEVGARTIDYPS